MENTYRSTSIPHVEVLNLSTPLFSQVELTRGCNYACIMCYNVWSDGQLPVGKDLSKEEHFEVLDKLLPYVLSVIFSGGEPTEVPWLLDLIRKVRASNAECTVITNGSNITKEFAQELYDAGLRGVQVSIHNPNPDVNDWVTNFENSLQRSLSGARNLAEVLGPEAVGICMVANKETVNDVYPMGMFIYEEGLKNLVVGVLSYSGRAAKNNLLIDKEDLFRILDQLEKLSQDLDLSVGLVGGFPFCVLPEKHRNGSISIHNRCDAALNQIIVGPDGNCRPCVQSTVVGGNILEKSLEEIWSSPEFLSIRNFENVPDSCVDCEFISDCHGGCRAAAWKYTGDVKGLDPLLLEKEKK